MRKNLFAYTQPGHAPGFVSINRLDNGDVEVHVRSEPKVQHNGTLFGAAASLTVPKDAYDASMSKFDGCDGCSTGDCPHTSVNECVQAQAKIIAQQAAEIERLKQTTP